MGDGQPNTRQKVHGAINGGMDSQIRVRKYTGLRLCVDGARRCHRSIMQLLLLQHTDKADATLIIKFDSIHRQRGRHVNY